MTAATPPGPSSSKPVAHTYEASSAPQQAAMLHMQTRCFLCAAEIGDADPRRFHVGSSGMMLLAHTGCLDKFEQSGHDAAPTPAPAPAPAVAPPPPSLPPSDGSVSVWFPSLNHLQHWVIEHGPIPPDTTVAIGDQVVQDAGARP